MNAARTYDTALSAIRALKGSKPFANDDDNIAYDAAIEDVVKILEKVNE